MNIMIVYPRPDEEKKPRFGFSYDMLQIATILSEQHNVSIHDYSCEPFDGLTFQQEVQDKHIELILIECDSFALKRSQNIRHAREIIQLVDGVIPTIAFGNYCYITRKLFSQADCTITMNDVNELLRHVYNYTSERQVPHYEQFDQLPFINRKLLLSIDYYKTFISCTLLQTAKGCENTCIFCQRKGWQEKYVAHSDEYVLQELKIVHDQDYKSVWIMDENFTFNLQRAKRLLAKIQKRSHSCPK